MGSGLIKSIKVLVLSADNVPNVKNIMVSGQLTNRIDFARFVAQEWEMVKNDK